MISTEIDRIHYIYQILHRLMPKYGRNFSLPQNTDPQKTYAWRYLTCFAKKLDEYEIDDDHLSLIIEEMLRYAKTRGLLKRGIAILIKQDILMLCIKKLEREEKITEAKTNAIKRSHLFLMDQTKYINDPRYILSFRRNYNSYVNMTCWFEQGLLSPEYIAISKACKETLSRLESSESELFPSPKELLKLKFKVLSGDTTELKNILGDDLLEE